MRLETIEAGLSRNENRDDWKDSKVQFIQKVFESFGREIDDMSGHVEAVPRISKKARLNGRDIGNLDDQSPSRLQQSGSIADPQSGIRQVFQNVKHGDEIESLVAPDVGSDFTASHGEPVLHSGNLDRPAGDIHPMRHKTARLRYMQESSIAAADVEQKSSGTRVFPGTEIQETHMIPGNEFPVTLFHGREKPCDQ